MQLQEATKVTRSESVGATSEETPTETVEEAAVGGERQQGAETSLQEATTPEADDRAEVEPNQQQKADVARDEGQREQRRAPEGRPMERGAGGAASGDVIGYSRTGRPIRLPKRFRE